MGGEVIAFPDAVKVGLAGIRPQLAARGEMCPVVSRVPKARPARFVRLERVGGTRRATVTDQAWLDVHCWAEDDDAAMALALLVRALFGGLRGVRGGAVVHDTGEVGGPHPMTDPASGRPYVAFTVWLDLRGRAL